MNACQSVTTDPVADQLSQLGSAVGRRETLLAGVGLFQSGAQRSVVSQVIEVNLFIVLGDRAYSSVVVMRERYRILELTSANPIDQEMTKLFLKRWTKNQLRQRTHG